MPRGMVSGSCIVRCVAEEYGLSITPCQFANGQGGRRLLSTIPSRRPSRHGSKNFRSGLDTVARCGNLRT